MKKNIFYLLAVLSINLYGCTTFDNNNEQQIQTYIEEIKEKQDSIEEETEAQQKKDIDSDETTGMNQIESIDYQDYSGFWTEGGISHEELLQNGGVEFYIEITNGNELKGYLYAQQETTERIAEIEDIVCVIEDGTCRYSFSDDGWGDSGTLLIQFGQDEIVIEVKDYVLSETNMIGFGIDRTYVLTRAQSTSSSEVESELSDSEPEIEILEQYQPDWTEDQVLAELGKRIKYYERCEFYLDVLQYMEVVREVTDISMYIDPLYETDKQYYAKEDFQDVPQLIIYLAKNEIYARHGYIFQNESLNNYFKGQLWYAPLVKAEEFDDSVFNEYEKENLKLLVELLR